MELARVKALAPGLVVGHVGPVCVTIWREMVDEPRFEQQIEGVREIVAKYPGRSAFACIIEPTCAPPSDALRKRSIELFNGFDRQLACIACVIEGTGFRASVARSVLAGMTLMMKSGTPRSFFAEPALASSWISRHVAVDSHELARAVAELRAKLA